METLYTLPEFTKHGLATTYEWLYSVAKVQLRAPGLGRPLQPPGEAPDRAAGPPGRARRASGCGGGSRGKAASRASFCVFSDVSHAVFRSRRNVVQAPGALVTEQRDRNVFSLIDGFRTDLEGFRVFFYVACVPS